MRRELRARFPRHRLQRKPLVNDPSMHHGMCVTHVPWCMSGSLSRDGGENVPGILGACATRNFTYMVRGPWNWINSLRYRWDPMVQNTTKHYKVRTVCIFLVYIVTDFQKCQNVLGPPTISLENGACTRTDWMTTSSRTKNSSWKPSCHSPGHTIG